MKKAIVLLTGAVFASTFAGAAFYQEGLQQQDGFYQPEGSYYPQAQTQIYSEQQLPASSMQYQQGGNMQTPYYQQDQSFYRSNTSERVHHDAYKTSEDKDLARQIRQALNNEREIRNPDSITVSVFDKKVSLEGNVTSREEKEAADDAAKSVSGVKNIDNHLTIASQGGAQSRFSNQTYSDQYGADQYRSGTQTRFNENSRYNDQFNNQSQFNNRSNDFNNQNYNQPSRFDSSSDFQNQSSYNDASSNPNSNSNYSNYSNDNSNYNDSSSSYSSNSSNTNLDDRIKQQLKDNFKNNKRFDSISVSVSKGTVTLSGSVPSDQDRTEAKNLARRINGVNAVKDQLKAKNATPTTGSATSGSSSSYSY